MVLPVRIEADHGREHEMTVPDLLRHTGAHRRGWERADERRETRRGYAKKGNFPGASASELGGPWWYDVKLDAAT